MGSRKGGKTEAGRDNTHTYTLTPETTDVTSTQHTELCSHLSPFAAKEVAAQHATQGGSCSAGPAQRPSSRGG